MKKLSLFSLMAFAAVAQAQVEALPIGAWTFENTLDPFIARSSYALPAEYFTGVDPTSVNLGAPTYSTEVVGSTTKQVAQFALGNWFKMYHGIGANGGGSYVNQWTFLYDINLDDNSLAQSFTPLYNSAGSNYNGAEAWIELTQTTPSVSGQFYTRGTVGGTFPFQTWQRLVMTVKATETELTYRYYLNGAFAHEAVFTGNWIDSGPTMYCFDDPDTYDNCLIFADSDGYYGSGKLSAFAAFDRPLNDAEVAALGGPGENPFVLLGDIDKDGEVGPGDFSLLANAFLSVPGDSNWNEDADLDGDGEIGPGDFSILANNFLRSAFE